MLIMTNNDWMQELQCVRGEIFVARVNNQPSVVYASAATSTSPRRYWLLCQPATQTQRGGIHYCLQLVASIDEPITLEVPAVQRYNALKIETVERVLAAHHSFRSGARIDDSLLDRKMLTLVRGCKYAVQLDHIATDDSVVYTMMEYLPENLVQRLTRLGPLPEAQACFIIADIVQGIQHLNSWQFAHMDLNPKNVMFDPKTSPATAKLIDFGAGITYTLDDEGRDVLHKRATRGDFGMRPFVAPELLCSTTTQPHFFPRACDIWSVGALLCLLLTCDPTLFTGVYSAPSMVLIRENRYREFFSEVNRRRQSNGQVPISALAEDFMYGILKFDMHKRLEVIPHLSSHAWLYTAPSLSPGPPDTSEEAKQLQ